MQNEEETINTTSPIGALSMEAFSLDGSSHDTFLKKSPIFQPQTS